MQKILLINDSTPPEVRKEYSNAVKIQQHIAKVKVKSF